MTAIVTSNFRTVNAENFKEDVGNNSVYVAIGKPDVWSLTTSDTTDTTPFTPNDHIDDAGEARAQFMAMQKGLDKLVEGFQEQLDEIRKEYEARSEKMRERYDRVIEEYRNTNDNQSKDFLITRTKVHNDIVSKLDRLLEKK